MDKCAVCGKELPPFTYRKPHADGFACSKCAGGKVEQKSLADGSEPVKAKPEPKPEAKSESEKGEGKKREVPGLSDAIDGLLKD